MLLIDNLLQELMPKRDQLGIEVFLILDILLVHF